MTELSPLSHVTPTSKIKIGKPKQNKTTKKKKRKNFFIQTNFL